MKFMSLDDWSIDAIKQLIHSRAGEDMNLDFKRELTTKEDPSKPNSTVKSAVAFANTEGGFLIFGIEDGSKVVGENRLCGVEDLEFRKHLEDKIAQITPPITFGIKALPLCDRREIYVVHIYKSKKLHSVRTASENCPSFFKRTQGGSCKAMSHEEIQAAFLAEFKENEEIITFDSQVRKIRELNRKPPMRLPQAPDFSAMIRQEIGGDN